eukprot:CAMPEP_0116009816 /NCGR_PEP_ID=MMETSP0321-20121206/3647_1 /TAXON_ID=163516 /ORGANISM="Leptocylindrus danicus var. danicus, Strain B650" /LENGTH=480 /DNA_ID=CAMNT_0003478829 /DNA_START=35 /DNA_END=1473 /DNA_ORIENTATION=+
MNGVEYAWSTVGDLLRLSATLTLATLAAVNVFSGYPIENIGQHTLHPKFQFRLQSIYGYDSSLGSWHPVLRSFIGFIAFLLIWAGVISAGVIFNLFEAVNYEADARVWVQHSQYAALAICLMHLYIQRYMVKGVSHPGGPREKKIRRVPHWDEGVRSLPSCFGADATVASGGTKKSFWDNIMDNNSSSSRSRSNSDKKQSRWRCAVAEASHEVTTLKFAGVKGAGMTGEPSGRQMWTLDEGKSCATQVDEALVQKLACGGREYDGFDPSKNPNSCDKIFRAQQIRNKMREGAVPPSLDFIPSTAAEAAKKGFHFYSMLQTEDGHWAGDYGGPHFLMPGIIIAWYVMGKPDELLDAHQRQMMLHYLSVHQQSDGGWGTHIESPSTMFGTVMCYVSMRLLGAPKDSEACTKAQTFILNEGGAVYTSSWSKFWLCLLGCMEWEGHNSVPPEMWLLPNWFPFHPGRLWCHCRMVYLPMGYLYGS